MGDEGWLEWSEISASGPDGAKTSQSGDQALLLTRHGCPLASAVVRTVRTPGVRENTIAIHPILYEFFSHLGEIVPREQSSVAKEPSNGWPFVTLQPLPIESIPLSVHLPSYSREGWEVARVPVHDLPRDAILQISCVFLEPKLAEYLEQIQKVSNDRMEFMFRTSLLGRIVKKACVLLLSFDSGFAVVQVRDIRVSGEATNAAAPDDFAYQIPLSFPTMKAEDWQFISDLPRSLEPHPRNKTGPPLETTIPGYQSLLRLLSTLVSIRGKPASSSGILITGPPGVGKSRLVACLANEHILALGQEKSSDTNDLFLLSTHDLIFRAATESDLYENVIEPGLKRCSLWVIDDLYLLERDGGEEDSAAAIDIEYMIVQNAIAHGIDKYRDTVCIIGVCQIASRLPNELVKVGRLEQHIEVPVPEQIQRKEIWYDLLSGDVSIETNLDLWSEALAETTSGCVAADLVRIHQSALTRSWAKNAHERSNPSLQWEDLRMCTRSCVPSQLADLDVTKPKVWNAGLSWKQIHEQSWSSFGGYQTLKRNVFRQVVLPWKQFLRRSQGPKESTKSWLDPPPGVLFHGMSGCGKTVAAKCLANSLELSMIQVRASDILDKWLGGSEALLRSLFARARAAAPCILFIDEIDSIANNRAEDDTNDYTSRILSTLLNEMDGVSSRTKKGMILVMACTNRLQSLDAALLRPGRLQEHFGLTVPTVEDTKEILQLYLKRVHTDENLNIDEIASALATQNATGADVEGFCREACLLAFRRAHEVEDALVSADEFNDAISKVRWGVN